MVKHVILWTLKEELSAIEKEKDLTQLFIKLFEIEKIIEKM